MPEIDILRHNRAAWNQLVDRQNRWTQPVGPETIERARRGDFAILLTPTKPVPSDWFPQLKHTKTLCLASGGGQQAPVLAAAGAEVTVLDNAPKQLDQDQHIAQREGLELKLVEGDMADLSMFQDGTFDFIFHPCSNMFAPSVRPVWRECARVLRTGGVLLAGFTNPIRYLFDYEGMDKGSLEVKHAIPYSDLDHQHEAYVQKMIADGEAIEFSHTLDDLIGGQLQAGFQLTGLYEDRYADEDQDPLSKFLATFIATRAVKQ